MPLRQTIDGGDKVVDRSEFPPKLPFPDEAFDRRDQQNDAVFYNHPRIGVHHIDDGCRARLTAWYDDFIRQNGFEGASTHIDLASSWVSHIPDSYKPDRCIGMGLNQQELDANPKLTDRHVIDLNLNPKALQDQLSLADGSVDLVNMDLSIDYMVRPLALLSSVYSALRPGGAVVLSFSNRMFHTKAVRMWLHVPDCRLRQKIVVAYLHFSGFDQVRIDEVPPPPSADDNEHDVDPLNIVVGFKKPSVASTATIDKINDKDEL